MSLYLFIDSFVFLNINKVILSNREQLQSSLILTAIAFQDVPSHFYCAVCSLTSVKGNAKKLETLNHFSVPQLEEMDSAGRKMYSIIGKNETQRALNIDVIQARNIGYANSLVVTVLSFSLTVVPNLNQEYLNSGQI